MMSMAIPNTFFQDFYIVTPPKVVTREENPHKISKYLLPNLHILQMKFIVKKVFAGGAEGAEK